jgi:DNA-binding Lrp family transcriptional regulator
MLEDLKLSSNNLLLYALIYGFSQDGKSTYNGSYDYISKLLNISRRTVINTIEDLSEKGLIKVIKSGMYNQYAAIVPENILKNTSAKIAPVTSAETAPTSAKIALSTSAKIAPNNNKKNNNINNDEERKTPTSFPNLVKQNIKLNQEVKVLDVINEMGADEVFIQHVQYETKKRTQRIVSPEKVKERLKEFYSHKLRTKGEEYDTRKNIRQHFLNWIVKQ